MNQADCPEQRILIAVWIQHQAVLILSLDYLKLVPKSWKNSGHPEAIFIITKIVPLIDNTPAQKS